MIARYVAEQRPRKISNAACIEAPLLLIGESVELNVIGTDIGM